MTKSEFNKALKVPRIQHRMQHLGLIGENWQGDCGAGARADHSLCRSASPRGRMSRELLLFLAELMHSILNSLNLTKILLRDFQYLMPDFHETSNILNFTKHTCIYFIHK